MHVARAKYFILALKGREKIRRWSTLLTLMALQEMLLKINMSLFGCRTTLSIEAVHTRSISQGRDFNNPYDFKDVVVGQTLPGKRKINLCLKVLSATCFTCVVS